jgi:hypothetical protein
MKSAQSLSVRIAPSDGREFTLEVDAAVAKLGRGAHCELQLSDPKVLPTHLELEARDGVVFARAVSHDAEVSLNGRRFHAGPLAPGARLRVGDTLLQVSLHDNSWRILRMRRAQRAAVNGLLALLVGVAGARLLAVPEPDVSSRLEARDWPPLLEPDMQPPCPERDAARAANLAHDSERAARALRERMAFFPGDGVRAVVSHQQAAACFALAGESSHAREARRVAAAIYDQVATEYRAHQVGLGWSLSRDDWGAIRRHSTELLALTSASLGGTAPIVEWLAELQHRAEQNAPRATR